MGKTIVNGVEVFLLSNEDKDILQRALYEYVYVAGRHDQTAYVNKRYPSVNFSEKDRDEKRRETDNNVKRALEIRKQLF